VAAQRKEITMNNPYDDLHYSSKLYREEVLRGANKRHLIALAKANREQPSRLGRFGLRCNRLLSLLLSPETSK
jgi:hypothetical protein